jgi:sugar O-acyltransferase (sialic acid O-acetyltransferase NeuD family)
VKSNRTGKLVILGGGHGCLEAISIVKRQIDSGRDCTIIGILDDNSSLHGKLIGGYEVLGPISDWKNFDSSHFFVHAIGTYSSRFSRKDIVLRNGIPETRFETLIDPSAVILVDDDSIGIGSIIHPGVVISVGTKIANFVVVSANSVIGVDNLVGSYSLFASGVSTSTNVKVGCMAFVGSGAAVAPDVELDCLSFVAVGTVVFSNVDAGHSVIGNPGRGFGKVDVPDEISELWRAEKIRWPATLD